MNSERYLAKLRADGDLIKQLHAHADEYLGPCGQSMTVMKASRIKRQALLEAAAEIERLRGERDECLRQINLWAVTGAHRTCSCPACVVLQKWAGGDDE